MNPLFDNNWYVIINPIAGSGSAIAAWREIERRFKKMGLEFQTSFTKNIGDGAGIAQYAAAQGFKSIMVFGGDGTLHDVTNGLLKLTFEQHKSICCTTFPCGTGNDFARHFKIPSKPDSWIKFLQSAVMQDIDICKIEMQDNPAIFFINEAGIGLQYEVAQQISLKNGAGGRLRYLLQTLKALYTYPGVKLRVKMNDSQSVDHVWNLTIANGRYLGGGFQLCPKASPKDGELSYTKIIYGPKWKLIKDIIRFFNGSIDTLSYTTCGETSKLLVEPLSLQEVFIEVDGEVRGHLPAEFSVIHKALNIYVPP